jgi:hypothetical protein
MKLGSTKIEASQREPLSDSTWLDNSPLGTIRDRPGEHKQKIDTPLVSLETMFWDPA